MFTAALCLSGCTTPTTVELPATLPPIRFLLTFDDGPSAAVEDNPTEQIANTLAGNPTQPGIKAIFFIQTRWSGAGGSAVGQRLLQRLLADGHVFGLHSGSAHGHVNHRKMEAAELAVSLADGHADIKTISGEVPGLIRPPFWRFDDGTLTAYERAGLQMLLTDLNAADGAHWLWQAHPDTGGRMHSDFAYLRHRLAQGRVPTVDGVIPVVVTFHDVNRYTAKHFQTYLATLVRAGREAGFAIAEPAFYSDRAAMRKAAHSRATNKATRADLPPSF
jgi:peptidoglycan/xylan/chitin deacetylase (PgdA/CDA1 family)